MRKQTIDTYKLTGVQEPTDSVLSQLMKEAAEDAKRRAEEARKQYFEQLRQDVIREKLKWLKSKS